MRICWPHPKAILNAATGALVRHPAGAPFEMPDEEAADRIRQGDCVAYVEPEAPPATTEETAPVEQQPEPPPAVETPAEPTGQQVQEGVAGVAR